MTTTEDTAVESVSPAKAANTPKPPSATHISLAKYVTENSGVEVTPEQAQAILVHHGHWQKHPDRVAERQMEAAAKAEAAEAAKQLAAQAKEERAAKREAEKQSKAAKAAAKKAAEAEDDSDLDSIDADDTGEDDEEGTPAPKIRRKPRVKGTGEF